MCVFFLGGGREGEAPARTSQTNQTKLKLKATHQPKQRTNSTHRELGGQVAHKPGVRADLGDRDARRRRGEEDARQQVLALGRDAQLRRHGVAHRQDALRLICLSFVFVFVFCVFLLWFVLLFCVGCCFVCVVVGVVCWCALVVTRGGKTAPSSNNNYSRTN